MKIIKIIWKNSKLTLLIMKILSQINW